MSHQGFGYEPQEFGYEPQGVGYEPQGFGYEPQGFAYVRMRLPECMHKRLLVHICKCNRMQYNKMYEPCVILVNISCVRSYFVLRNLSAFPSR